MKTVSRKIALVICLVAILIGAVGAYVVYKATQPEPALGAAMEASFPRPNYFALFVTPEMGEYVQLLYKPTSFGAEVLYTAYSFENGQWIYTWPGGETRSVMPINASIPVFWAINKDANLVEANVWVDEYGVWIDMRLFDDSLDV